MTEKKIKTEKVQSGSSYPYSLWSRTSFCWNKQLVICFGTLDLYTIPDPPMPPPPPGTKDQWTQQYEKEEADNNNNCLQELINAENEYHLSEPTPNNQPHLLDLLPEYNPCLLSPISSYQKVDWDETHPKTKLGVTMKGG